MSITELSEQFHLSFKDTLKKLRELENEGNLIGFQNDDEYFFLTQKEVYFLTKIFTGVNKKSFKDKEIQNLFNEIIQYHEEILNNYDN